MKTSLIDFAATMLAAITVGIIKVITLSVFAAMVIYTTTQMLEWMGFFQ